MRTKAKSCFAKRGSFFIFPECRNVAMSLCRRAGCDIWKVARRRVERVDYQPKSDFLRICQGGNVDSFRIPLFFPVGKTFFLLTRCALEQMRTLRVCLTCSFFAFPPLASHCHVFAIGEFADCKAMYIYNSRRCRNERKRKNPCRNFRQGFLSDV